MNTKQFVLMVIVLFLTFHSYCQTSVLTLKKIERDFIKINDTLLAYKYETSNELYNLFLSKQTVNDFNSAFLKVDSTNWRILKYSNEPYAQYYHLHPCFLEYPVVNIRYESAISFCNWLTKYYNNYPKRKYKKVEIRLPSSEEWDMLLCNVKFQINNKQTNKYISSIYSYKSGRNFFNVLENVKEMTNIKGQAKGGDWKNGINLSNLDFQYNEASTPFVGFRFFVVIKEK